MVGGGNTGGVIEKVGGYSLNIDGGTENSGERLKKEGEGTNKQGKIR